MPFGDGTGPSGQGPMTGRAAGFCAGFSRPGNSNPSGRGFFGFGRRRRNRFFATGQPWWARFGAPAQDEEKEALKDQAENLKSSLNAVNERLKKLESEK